MFINDEYVRGFTVKHMFRLDWLSVSELLYSLSSLRLFIFVLRLPPMLVFITSPIFENCDDAAY